MSEEPRAGTTASLDRRVERLEMAQGEMANVLDRVEREQKHGRELAELRFSGLESAVKAQSAMIGGVAVKLDTLISTIRPGAILAQELEELKAGRDENRAAIKAMEKRYWIATGVTIGSIIAAPALRDILVALLAAFQH